MIRNKIGTGILLLLIGILMLLPFLWVISTSLRMPSESFTLPPAFFPTSFRFSNYARTIDSNNIERSK